MFKTFTTRRLLINEIRLLLTSRHRSALTNNSNQLANANPQNALEVLDTRFLPNDFVDSKNRETSVLEDCREDISHVAPYLKPTFNLAAYVNKSETLQQFVKLGVNLHEIEKTADAVPLILKLDFERDVKGYILFLHDRGLSLAEVADVFTKNPFIFKESLEDLQVRVNYLQYKRFNNEMIKRVLSRNAFWLSFSTQQIDERLGFFQKYFKLNGDQVRYLAVKKPKLITSKLENVRLNVFVLKEEMGFTDEEMKRMILKKPSLLTKSQTRMLKVFEYVHREMGIPLEMIVELPEVLMCREFRLKQRYLFLKTLGRIQFDPKQPKYISLLDIISGTDAHFSTEVAKSSVEAFNAFLKTL